MPRMGSGSAGFHNEDPQDVIMNYRQRIDELQAQLESENNAHRATLEALRDCSKQLAATQAIKDTLAHNLNFLEERLTAQSAQLKAAREALKSYPSIDAALLAQLIVSDWQSNGHCLSATVKSHLKAAEVRLAQYRKQALAAIDGEVKS